MESSYTHADVVGSSNIAQPTTCQKEDAWKIHKIVCIKPHAPIEDRFRIDDNKKIDTHDPNYASFKEKIYKKL